MAGEDQHEAGREGVRFVRTWLDRTTRVAITWDVYEGSHHVKMPQLHGMPRAFDMRGHLINADGSSGSPLLVEVKAYKVHNPAQNAAYLDFLAKCYSATAKAEEDGVDSGTEFMWITWHPFNLNDWTSLDTASWVERALDDNDLQAEYLGAAVPNKSLMERTAERIIIVLMGKRTEELTMADWLIKDVKRLMYARSSGD